MMPPGGVIPRRSCRFMPRMVKPRSGTWGWRTKGLPKRASGVVVLADRGDTVVAVHLDLGENCLAALQQGQQPLLGARVGPQALVVGGQWGPRADGHGAQHRRVARERQPVRTG